jgi:site-specific DNA-methyltransferase (adenine-specific)
MPKADWEDRKHGIRLYKGDCLRVLPDLKSASIDFIFADPPYGHNNNNNDLIHRWESALGQTPYGKDSPLGRPILNDGPEANQLIRSVFPQWARLLRCCCCCCCCCGGGGGPDPQFARWSLWIDEVMHFKQMVVWDKGPIGMGWHYRRSYETVLVAQKGKGKTAWFDHSHKIENIIRPGYKGIKKIIPKEGDHPTPKPWELAAHFIRLHTRRGQRVLDSFMGGGSTAIACLETGRKFSGIELDPVFFAASVERIEAWLSAHKTRRKAIA